MSYERRRRVAGPLPRPRSPSWGSGPAAQSLLWEAAGNPPAELLADLAKNKAAVLALLRGPFGSCDQSPPAEGERDVNGWTFIRGRWCKPGYEDFVTPFDPEAEEADDAEACAALSLPVAGAGRPEPAAGGAAALSGRRRPAVRPGFRPPLVLGRRAALV